MKSALDAPSETAQGVVIGRHALARAPDPNFRKLSGGGLFCLYSRRWHAVVLGHARISDPLTGSTFPGPAGGPMPCNSVRAMGYRKQGYEDASAIPLPRRKDAEPPGSETGLIEFRHVGGVLPRNARDQVKPHTASTMQPAWTRFPSLPFGGRGETVRSDLPIQSARTNPAP